ncbi:MAG TPA: hypothetical protein VJV04_13755 [Nitrospiraceae bacterium]|nr:hypothetical protein [Nitrospiraceae bacterium]
MTQVLRCYFVDGHDHVKRMPVPHYRRLMAGDMEMAVLAGKAVRFAEMTLWLDEDRIITRALTWFPLVHFDSDGRRDLEKRRQEMSLVMREVESSTESHWSELYRAERFAAFRWLPSQHILAQLQEFLPHHPTQASTLIHKKNL